MSIAYTAYMMFGDALSTHMSLLSTLESLEDESLKSAALTKIRKGREAREGVTGLVVRTAQAKILGEPLKVPSFEPVSKPVEQRLFETLAKAWLTWATGGDPLPLLEPQMKPAEYGGALQLMTLEPLRDAIKALSKRDPAEAKRFFRRAIELGTQYGSETSEEVQWMYAASFFHGATSEG